MEKKSIAICRYSVPIDRISASAPISFKISAGKKFPSSVNPIPIRTANIKAFEKYSFDVSLSVILQSEYRVAEPIPINEPMANNTPYTGSVRFNAAIPRVPFATEIKKCICEDVARHAHHRKYI